MPIDALSVLCAQLTRDLLAIAKFLFCPGTDISPTVQPTVVKFCMMIYIRPDVSSPLLVAVPPGGPHIQNVEPLKSEYIENGKLQRYMSII